MSRVTIVDYGMGNVLSVKRAVEHCGAEGILSADAHAIAAAERVILPGVGTFGDCMKALADRKLIDPIKQFVATGRPFLGICVGMQILLDFGEEFGGHEGLGLIAGRVAKIGSTAPDGTEAKVPHIGWAPIAPPRLTNSRLANGHDWEVSILAGTPKATPFYFVHSFAAVPDEPGDVLASATYAGMSIVAVVKRENITGVQFHPEKSGPAGLKLLTAFVE